MVDNNTDDDRTNYRAQSEPTRATRRGMLKATSVAAAAVTGIVGASGSATAYCWKNDGYDYSGWTPNYDLPSRDHNSFPWGTDELTLYIHGFNGRPNATDQGSEVRTGLRNNGYWGDFATILWHSDTGWTNFSAAEDNADEAGGMLADMLERNNLTLDGGTNVRLIGFSLGTRVALECARQLAARGDRLATVNLLGSAVPEDWVQGRYSTGIASGTARTHNYHSPNDPVLYCHLADSLGHHGTQGWNPSGYTDYQVSYVEEHNQFMHRSASLGCVNNIVNNDPGM